MIPLGQQPRTLGELFWSQYNDLQLQVVGLLGQMRTALEQAQAQRAISPTVYTQQMESVSGRYEEEKLAMHVTADYLQAAKEDADKLPVERPGPMQPPLQLHRPNKH